MFYHGSTSYQHKESGLERDLEKRCLGRLSKCRRQVATKLMVQVGREAKVRRVGRAWR